MGQKRVASIAAVAVVVVMAAICGPAAAAHAETPVAGPKTAVDPAAIAALKKMGAFLRRQSTFTIDAESTTDEILDSGQKVKRGGVAHIKVRRPDRLRADLASDDKDQQIFYDGKTFTIFQPQAGYFAAFVAPPTLAEMVDVAEKRYGIDLPLADLFYWGSDQGNAAAVRSAVNLGPSLVKGVVCDHFAFRQADVDWQVWIQRGDKPLPSKLVVTTTSASVQPEHEVLLAWNLSPKIDDKVFAFTPPPTAHQIQFQALGPMPAGMPRPSGKTPGKTQGNTEDKTGGTTP